MILNDFLFCSCRDGLVPWIHFMPQVVKKSMLLEVLPGTDLNDAAKKEETQNDSWNPPEGSALHDFFVVPVFAAFSLYVVNVFAFSSA